MKTQSPVIGTIHKGEVYKFFVGKNSRVSVRDDSLEHLQKMMLLGLQA